MAQGLRLQAVEPSVFFVREGDSLGHLVTAKVMNSGAGCEAVLVVRWAGGEQRSALGMVGPGEASCETVIPDIREPGAVEFELEADGQVQDRLRVDWVPTRHWEVYVAHGSHHDLGYTDLPSNVLREHDEFLDEVVRFCAETSDFPEESRFRYVVEQGWSVLHYVANRRPEAVEKLVQLMREGRIEVTALFGNETSELCGHEEQIRLTYPSFRLKRRFGIPIRAAELNDVPGLSWGLVSVLTGAGVRYIMPGLPDYFSWGPKHVHPFWDEQIVLERDMSGAFWWEGPDGARLLFWYRGAYIDLWTYEQAVSVLSKRLEKLAQRGYAFDPVLIWFQGGHRDNSPPSVRLSLIAREWGRRWAYPKLIVSTLGMFFERFEQEAGSQLRVLRGDLPNTDYTVGSASTARETGINRLAHDTLTSAEKLAACATLVSDYEYPADTLAEAYDCAMLYDEHTWGMGQSVGPAQDGCWSQKSQFAYRAAALAHDVLSKATNRIADQVRLMHDGYHIVVFNPLAYERSDVVCAQAIPYAPCGRPLHWQHPKPGTDEVPTFVSGTAIGRSVVSLPREVLEAPFELVDVANGRSLPYQIVTLDDPLAARPFAAFHYAMGGADALRRKALVFVAEGVPGLGYRTYRIVPADRWPAFESSVVVKDHVLENRYYRVTLDAESGAVASIFDKELGREWVDGTAPYGFNQLLVRSPETGVVAVAGRSQVQRGEVGPVLGSLIARGDGLGCPQRTQEITLYEGLKRIDVANRLLKDATPLLETYFAFPFALEAPRFRYDGSNAVIEPIRDQLPGSNTDAYVAHHWVSVSDQAGSVAWSSLEAPVMEVGGLWPGYVSQAHHGVTPPGYGHEFLKDPAQLTKGHIYSYAMVSNFRTNFQPVQVGDVLFRYAIGTYRGSWSVQQAREMGETAATPLEAVFVTGPAQGALESMASFCQLDQPNVALRTLKAAENGDGLILRLAETEGRDTQVTVTLPFLSIQQAFRSNLVEEDQGMLSYSRHMVHVPIAANSIVTVRCRAARTWPAVAQFARY